MSSTQENGNHQAFYVRDDRKMAMIIAQEAKFVIEDDDSRIICAFAYFAGHLHMAWGVKCVSYNENNLPAPEDPERDFVVGRTLIKMAGYISDRNDRAIVEEILGAAS